MHHRETDREFLRRRLDDLCEGLKEGVRREVKRLRETSTGAAKSANETSEKAMSTAEAKVGKK